MRKIAILLIAFIVISVGILSGCNEQSSDTDGNKNTNGGETEIEFVNATLDIISLKASDVPSSFVKSNETYKSEPYNVNETNSPFYGDYVLESYVVKFLESETNGLSEGLIKFPTKNEAKDAFDHIKSVYAEQGYLEQSMTTIGDESCLFKGKLVSQTGVDYYILLFSFGNVFAILDGTVSLQPYAEIIENNIINSATN